jgi:hypothetical protein
MDTVKLLRIVDSGISHQCEGCGKHGDHLLVEEIKNSHRHTACPGCLWKQYEPEAVDYTGFYVAADGRAYGETECPW